MRVKFIKPYRQYRAGDRINVDRITGMGLIAAALALPDEYRKNKSLSGKVVEKKG
ncbi:MAG TPA: hypothetical protein PLV57_21915 [Phycisphaerae bacterium]|nr:hypothetical protein [Phycisphaerae bacterium]